LISTGSNNVEPGDTITFKCGESPFEHVSVGSNCPKILLCVLPGKSEGEYGLGVSMLGVGIRWVNLSDVHDYTVVVMLEMEQEFFHL
jgi:hypothetical protein